MTGQKAAKQLEQLAQQIDHHEERYRAGEPEISDAAFDEIWDSYRQLADELGVDARQRVDARPGADHSDGFVTVEHRIPMLSLEKLSPNRRDSHGELVSISDQLDAWYLRRSSGEEHKGQKRRGA